MRVKEGGFQEQEGLQAHYFGYVCNFATTHWFQLDDKEIKEVEEEDDLKNSQDKDTQHVALRAYGI